jgi:ribosomal protein S18 acetylase RimI-like enzyme
MYWRTSVQESDVGAVAALVADTGFFSAPEVDVARELVEETLSRGTASGYQFVFVDDPANRGALLAYTCFGPIPATASSFDLYWIAVAPGEQGRGLGARLMRESERIVTDMLGTKIFIDTSGREQYTATRAFYERMGYEVVARITDFYAPGDDKVIYGKTLAIQASNSAG